MQDKEQEKEKEPVASKVSVAKVKEERTDPVVTIGSGNSWENFQDGKSLGKYTTKKEAHKKAISKLKK